MENDIHFPCLLRYKTKLKDARKFRASFLLSFRVQLLWLGLFAYSPPVLVHNISGDRMNSLWCDNINAPKFNSVEGDIKTDVLIIGGGLAGLLCAYKLHRAGVDYTLVEADRICGGVTQNTTAKISAQHGLIYADLIKKFGEKAAKTYLTAHLEAVEQYARMCESIDCDFEYKDSFVYSLKGGRSASEELLALKRLGYEPLYSRQLPLPLSIAGAVGFANQAQFHPLKFAYAIAEGLNVYENSKVTALKDNTAVTARGKITAKKIIVATHFPIMNKHGLYSMKMHQHRSYVLAIEGAESIDGMYRDADDKGLSFRTHGNLLLLGGGSHRTGEKGGGWTELKAFADQNYPNAQIKYKWATQDCITLDKVAYIGPYSSTTKNIYAVTGFNKWGMTTSMIAADMICCALSGKRHPCDQLMSPSRSMLHPTLAVNAFKAAANILRPTAPRCTHMGCALKYNSAEHSWDCACHGSRFDGNGKVLDNPAADDLKKKP